MNDDDMTYEPVTGVTTLRRRVQELEAQLNAAILGQQELEQSRDFWKSAAIDWKERWEAVPVKILREDYHRRFGTRELRWWPEWALPIGRWLFPEVQPDDDTDAPLTLAAIDEDGNE
jgi:hypothetical protein